MIDKKLISYYFLTNRTTHYLQGDAATIEFLKKQNFDSYFMDMFDISEEYTIEEFCNFNYEFDEYGFRKSKLNSPSMDNTPNEIWCFGDSFTMGTGVPSDRAWPAILQEYTNQKVINFGVGGCGPETTLRLLNNWLKHSKYKPTNIFIYGFFPGRFEVQKDLDYMHVLSSEFADICNMYPDQERQMKHKMLNIDALYTIWNKNISDIAFSNNIKYHMLDINELNDWRYGDTISWGRDLDPKPPSKHTNHQILHPRKKIFQSLHLPYYEFTDLMVVHPGINHHKFIAKEFSKHL